MTVRQTFAPGQTVTVLTDDAFLFVGKIIACDCEFKCDICDERPLAKFTCDHDDHKDDHKHDHKGKDKDKDRDCDRFLVLQLEQDVNVGPGQSEIAFEEGDTVFINFCQIIAISLGFPPTKKKE